MMLKAYDAGTDSGTTFTAADKPTPALRGALAKDAPSSTRGTIRTIKCRGDAFCEASDPVVEVTDIAKITVKRM